MGESDRALRSMGTTRAKLVCRIVNHELKKSSHNDHAAFRQHFDSFSVGGKLNLVALHAFRERGSARERRRVVRRHLREHEPVRQRFGEVERRVREVERTAAG